MWKWEQGRLEYFQFDELRKIAKFGVANNLRQATRSDLEDAVGLPFLPQSPAYRPWRNYARLFQIALIATPKSTNQAEITELGRLLAGDGKVTADEYLHFLAQATTQPSPALSDWDHTADFRYPLLFALRFILARASQHKSTTQISDVVDIYRRSGFCGDEGQEEFLGIIDNVDNGVSYPPSRYRQPSESIKVLAQLSYLTATKDTIFVSLTPSDASDLFEDLKPVRGQPLKEKSKEINRRANLFLSAIADMETNYPQSIVSIVSEAGFDDTFREGERVRRTHISIERNQMIRSMFFRQNPISICDICGMDTHHFYPWVERLLEVHHLLPLCSGARTSKDGTLLEDLVANCPSCHRAVHRYYDKWLGDTYRVDFTDADEAKQAYAEAKNEHQKAVRNG